MLCRIGVTFSAFPKSGASADKTDKIMFCTMFDLSKVCIDFYKLYKQYKHVHRMALGTSEDMLHHDL